MAELSEERKEQLRANLAKGRAKLAQQRAEEAANPVTKPKAAQQTNEPSATEGADPGRVQELVGMYPQVSLEIKRLENMKWCGIEDTLRVAPSALYAFKDLIEPLAGGGQYSVRVRDPDNLGDVLMKFSYRLNTPPRPRYAAPTASPWTIPLPGGLMDGPPPPPPPWAPPPQAAVTPTAQPLPTTPTPTPQDPAAMQTPPYPPPGAPPHWASYPIATQWAWHFQQMQPQQQPRGGTWASDQLAMQQVQQLTGEKARLEAQLTAERSAMAAAQKSTDEKIATIQRDLERARDDERRRADKAEADARETRIRAEAQAREDALKAAIDRINAKLEAGATQKAPEAGPEKWAWLVPIITTYLGSQAAKSEADLKRSMDTMRFVLDSTKQPPDAAKAELTKTVIDMLKLRNEEKVAGTEAQVMMLGALSTFIKEQQGPAPPWWLPMIESVVDSIKAGVATAVVASTQGPGAAPPAHLPASTQTQPTVEAKGEAVQGPPGMPPAEAAQWKTFMETDELAAKATFAAYQSTQMPADLKTHEWRLILFNLHLAASPGKGIDPEVLAPIAADHLEHLRTFDLLPASFQLVFTEPGKAFDIVLRALPIWHLNQKYAEAFLEEIVGEIEGRETERKRVEKEEAEEEAKAANGGGAEATA